MGICESKNQSETLEKGNIKGNGKGIPVIHTLIQPIIHQNIQPIITKNINLVLRRFIIPVYVRNEMEFQNIPKELILNHPDVIKAIGHLPKGKPIEKNEQPIKPPPNSENNAEDDKKGPKLNFESEPTLVKVVGELHHYIQVKEMHTTHIIPQEITQDDYVLSIKTEIVPVIIP